MVLKMMTMAMEVSPAAGDDDDDGGAAGGDTVG